jgi:hypothetical protein
MKEVSFILHIFLLNLLNYTVVYKLHQQKLEFIAPEDERALERRVMFLSKNGVT